MIFFGYNRAEYQIRAAVVYQTVLVTVRAVGAAACGKRLIYAVAEHFSLAREDKDDFAVSAVGVQPY